MKAMEARRQQALEAERQKELERQRENRRFVFVQPRLDMPAPKPPPRADLSDIDRRARTTARAPKPTNPLPFARGNTAERIEASAAERRGAAAPRRRSPSRRSPSLTRHGHSRCPKDRTARRCRRVSPSNRSRSSRLRA